MALLGPAGFGPVRPARFFGLPIQSRIEWAMKTKWKVIARYTDFVEAQLAQSFLENQEIPCNLRDRHTISINFFYSNALGGIRLEVPTERADQATQLLQQVSQHQFELSEDHSPGGGPPCPKCESSETEYSPDHQKGWALLLWYVLFIPLPFLARDRWQCRQCRHSWHVSHHQHPLNYIVPILLMTGLIFFAYRFLGGDGSSPP